MQSGLQDGILPHFYFAVNFAQPRCDSGSPIATLRRITTIAEDFGHQPVKDLRDRLDIDRPCPRMIAEAIAG